jgi:hypothetical protein
MRLSPLALPYNIEFRYYRFRDAEIGKQLGIYDLAAFTPK